MISCCIILPYIESYDIILNYIVSYDITLNYIVSYYFNLLYYTWQRFLNFSLFFWRLVSLLPYAFSAIVYTEFRQFGAIGWIELSRELDKNNWKSYVSQESSTIKSFRKSDKKNSRWGISRLFVTLEC